MLSDKAQDGIALLRCVQRKSIVLVIGYIWEGSSPTS